MTITRLLVCLSALALLSTSCEKKESETKISTYNDTESHNMGKNCMDCHKTKGDGEGIFTIAGTVYDSLHTSVYPNATIKLFDGPNGTGALKAILEVDGNGNFYTTEIIDISTGVFPEVIGSTSTYHMSFDVSAGQCNSCHGVSTSGIWVK